MTLIGMRSWRLVLLAFLLNAILALGQEPFLSTNSWTLLRNESSGAVPYENLRFLTGLHRVPATPEYEEAAAFMQQGAQEYGLSDVHSEQFPIDGTKTYGLMRSYFGWKVEEGLLWEVHPGHVLIGDWKTEPIRLADYSQSANVEAQLIDVGTGASEADYSNKDVRGKIVLADGVLARVQDLAVGAHGAAGIVSDMPNQTTAWAGVDPTLIRWGHLNARGPGTFAFMVSRQTAESLRTRLRAGERIVLNAAVKATVGPGHWTVVSGTIPGSNPATGEIVYSCHLDHERPGANDNGSGCVTILESARVLAHLIATGALPQPKRTLRFVWGPEVEGTMAFLASHPEIRKNLRANIHMDMVGGDPFKNKSVFHVSATPWSLPSFVTDVGSTFMETIRSAGAHYAEGDTGADSGIVENGDQGTSNQLVADVTPYAAGSDHDDYDSSTIAVPSLYLRDWPDIYIHTDHDTLSQIDATKLRRVALLGASAGYVYATLEPAQLSRLLPFIAAQSVARLSQSFADAQQLLEDPQLDPTAAWYESHNLLAQSGRRELSVLHSLVEFTAAPANAEANESTSITSQLAVYSQWIDNAARQRRAKGNAPIAPWASDPDARRIPVRIGEFGPLTYQNDNVLLARLGKDRYSQIKLLNSDATPLLKVNDQSELYAYEIANFVDGKRSIGEIRDAVSAEYGPLPLNLVSDYLNACVEAKVMQWK
jgi:aminopeptidase YwaD